MWEALALDVQYCMAEELISVNSSTGFMILLGLEHISMP